MSGQAVEAPTVAGLRPPANPLDPRVKDLWRAYGLITAGVLALIAAGVLVPIALVRDGGVPVYVWGPVIGALASLLVGVLLLPDVVYVHERWEVTPLGLYVQSGWLWKTWTILPHSRIQAVDTTSGVLERRYGLATVHARTASAKGGGEVSGLSVDDAERLTRELAARAGEGEAV